ncbi:pimeloyl-ACP methyl ester carboxylesterase [Rhizobium tibeticum]|uniref:alpha/beta fold hydrolase n=1 Tax=Rhizobium tibeticum TaxID=501024 RepID=UPI002788E155|nr:alpha/beta hydrolase [Rhizobium tibeticum]MDP9813733.1 pimeloyl-ACP methyl ester carboxylesterase [Rhizobium tibeticum]
MVVELALGADALDEEPFHSAVRRTDGRARQYMIESAVAGEDSHQRFIAKTTSIPLAIINGENDPAISLDYIDSIDFANIWEGEPIRIRGAGDGVHREKTEKFNEILLRFEDFVRSRSSLVLEGGDLGGGGWLN